MAGRVVRLPPRCDALDGYNVHAGVLVGGHDEEAVERLCRYMCRRPLAKGRIEEAPGGGVVRRFKRPWSDGTTGLRLTDLELVQRLAALVPPPHANMVLYHSVFRPSAAWRDQVVPTGPEPEPSRGRLTKRAQGRRGARTGRRWPWSDLLWHVFGVDGFRCPRCGERRVVRAVVIPPAVEQSSHAAGARRLPDAAASCVDILAADGSASDGTDWIDPDDDGDTTNAFAVYCDMANGGWALCFELENTTAEDLTNNIWFDDCVDYTEAAWTGAAVRVLLEDASGTVLYDDSGDHSGVDWTHGNLTSTASSGTRYHSYAHNRLVTLGSGDKLMLSGRNAGNSGCGGSMGNGHGVVINASSPVYCSDPKMFVFPYQLRNTAYTSSPYPRSFIGWTTSNEISYNGGATFNPCSSPPPPRAARYIHVLGPVSRVVLRRRRDTAWRLAPTR